MTNPSGRLYILFVLIWLCPLYLLCFFFSISLLLRWLINVWRLFRQRSSTQGIYLTTRSSISPTRYLTAWRIWSICECMFLLLLLLLHNAPTRGGYIFVYTHNMKPPFRNHLLFDWRWDYLMPIQRERGCEPHQSFWLLIHSGCLLTRRLFSLSTSPQEDTQK